MFSSLVTNILYSWISSFELIIYFCLLIFFLSFFLFLSLRFLHGNILICTMNWISACCWFLFRVFWKKFIFRLKEGIMENLLIFGMKKHDHISFWVLIAWSSKRLTPATNFSDSQHSTLFFLNAFEERRLKMKLFLWQIQLIAPVWCSFIALMSTTGYYWDKSFFFQIGWMKDQRGF